jgi:hypothetical protein
MPWDKHMKRLLILIIIILLSTVPWVVAADLFLDLAVGDTGTVTCAAGQLSAVSSTITTAVLSCDEIPPPPDNLLLNPDFAHGFTDWSVDCTNCWRLSVKPSNPSPSDTAGESDQDWTGGGGVAGWTTGTDGRLWQDVATPYSHTLASLTLSEVHHHGDNTAVFTVYGYDNSEWVELWSRPEFGTDVPYNTIANRNTWYTNTYTMPGSYEAYRIEFYSEILACLAEDEDCGWKFTLLRFGID